MWLEIRDDRHVPTHPYFSELSMKMGESEACIYKVKEMNMGLDSA